ncbi:MAG: peroxiredoxin family protein, partial [Candidatus Binatia bacterium]
RLTASKRSMVRTTTRKREKHRRERLKSGDRGVGRRWLAGAILAVGMAAGLIAWQRPGMLWGYKKAPSFTLQSSSGRVFSLEDFRGKKEVVLIFYMGAG